MNNFDSKRFVKDMSFKISETVGMGKVLCALSGGVDSSVSAVLTQRAVGNNLVCIFVDHGLMRKGEPDQVMEDYGKRFNLRIKRVDAAERFLGKLAGVTDPEQKRKVIGAEFISVFEEEANKLRDEEGEINFLLQGTIYPDVLESASGGKGGVKAHHNVGGLPEKMNLGLIEPLRMLYKDQVRMVGEDLGIAPELVWRQPFPGPGLGVRCLGEVTREKLDVLREADAIVREEIDNYNEGILKETGVRNSDRAVWQYFAFLPGVQSVGVRDDARTFDHAVGIRAVHSVDAMTANWARLPLDILETISDRILAEAPGVNRVFYDLTKKPPGTIEWE